MSRNRFRLCNLSVEDGDGDGDGCDTLIVALQVCRSLSRGRQPVQDLNLELEIIGTCCWWWRSAETADDDDQVIAKRTKAGVAVKKNGKREEWRKINNSKRKSNFH